MQTTEAMASDAYTRTAPLADDIVSRIVDQKYLDFEVGLFATKWFDYRHLTPLQSTKLYMDEYSRLYKDYYARELDRERAQYVRPFDAERVMLGLEQGASKYQRILISCWRGRQVADALGVPYDVYIDLALSYRLRNWNQLYLPQPQHLYHEWDVEKIQARWEELQASRLYTSDHPAYLVQNYKNIAHQNDYHEWLLKQALMRTDPPEYLARFVEEDLLPIEKVEHRIPPELFDRVQKYLQ